MQEVSLLGRNRNALIESGRARMIVTLEVGPRILHLDVDGGENLMYVFDQEEGEYRFYGGHRLWIAPEEPERTMQPENEPIEAFEREGEFVFRNRPDVNRIQKELGVRALGGERFVVRHTVTNAGAYAVELGVWALSMLRDGAKVYWPQPPFEAHTDRVLPTRPLATWGYTRLGDPRWTWGDRVGALRQDSARGPQKIGTFVAQGYAAAEVGGHLLVKRFPAEFGAPYPDFGCNFETFTNEEMIEIESLGPMTLLEPGESVEHVEHWRLFPGERVPDGDDAAAEFLATRAAEV